MIKLFHSFGWTASFSSLRPMVHCNNTSELDDNGNKKDTRPFAQLLSTYLVNIFYLPFKDVMCQITGVTRKFWSTGLLRSFEGKKTKKVSLPRRFVHKVMQSPLNSGKTFETLPGN